MSANNTSESTALAVAARPQFDLSPQTFEQALTFSQYLADSDLVPKDFKGKPGNCLIAMQWGSEIGLKPLQALSNIAVINGRAALWGDAVIALVRGSALCEWVIETDDGHAATCKVKRRGEPEQARTFSMDDAKAAGLMGKQGPWAQYPKRMRQMRARAFALRDVFPDVLRGLPVAEEVMDTPPPAERHMGPAEVVQPAATAALPEFTPAQFDKNFPTYQAAIEAGRKTAQDVLATLATKFTLSEEQKAKLLSVKKKAEDITDAAPRVSYAAVADAIAAAKDQDALQAAADLIAQVADAGQRIELTQIAARRADELPPF